MPRRKLLTAAHQRRLLINGLHDDRDHFPVSLTELQTLRGRLGLPVERDAFFVADKPLSAYAEQARLRGAIIF